MTACVLCVCADFYATLMHTIIIRPTPFEKVLDKSVSVAYLSTNFKPCNQTATYKCLSPNKSC